MAHTCPECGVTCHCGGDIDDIDFGEPDGYCSCCDHDDDEECEWCGSTRCAGECQEDFLTEGL